MSKQEFSVPSLMKRLNTEADAYLLLEDLRWPDGQPEFCPQCGTVGRCYYLNPANGASRKTRTGAVSERRVWKCGSCRKQFSALTGTIFHGTKISLRVWLLVILEMCASKNGVSAREIERKYDLTPKTAWFLLHRIREGMKREPMAGLLSGVVIADETWVGGDPKNRHASARIAEGASRWTTDKTTVLSVIDKASGEARSAVVPNVKAATLRKAMEAELMVNLGASELHTDSATYYRSMEPILKGHQSVNHNEGEYVRGDVTSNAAEGYFSQLKRSIDGTHHHVSTEHLQRYLNQFDFMYTHCKDTDSERMRTLVGNVEGRRLTYRPLTNGS